MCIFSLCEFAAINSRIHYAKSRMLKGGDWQALAGAPDLRTAVGDLGSLPAGERLVSERVDGSLSLHLIEHSLQQNFITDMLAHMRFLSGASAEALRELVRVYDLMNLKKVLRIKLGYEGKDKMSELFVDLYDLGRHSLLRMEKWEELSSGGKIGNAFAGSCYEEDFKLDIELAGESAGLLRLETLIERSYFKNLFNCLRKSGGVELLRMYLDELCLEQMARLRYHFEMEIPAILPLTMLELSASFDEKLFMKLMKAEDERKFFALLSAEQAFKGYDCSSLGACLRSMRLKRMKECRTVLSCGAALSLKPLAALFMLRQQEIRDIVSALQIKRFQREQKKGWLVMPEVGKSAIREASL